LQEKSEKISLVRPRTEPNELLHNKLQNISVRGSTPISSTVVLPPLANTTNGFINNLNFKTMALEMNDLMALKSLENGMSPYEQFKVGNMQSRRPSGTATAGLVLGSVGAALAIGAWIFGPIISNNKANGIKDLANARYDATRDTLNQIAGLLAAERNERIAGDVNITTTINDTLSGTQQGQLTAQQQAELAASQVATQQVMTGLMTGRYSENPQRVALYQDARPCACPASNCGCCNG
jgi:hypothetical protein